VNLRDVLASLVPDADAGFSTEVPAEWNQGRTLYGGLNAALAARAARLSEPDLPALRALQIAFIAPPVGRLRYVPSVLRRGRSVTFIGVDGWAGSALCTRAILTFGQARDTQVTHARLAAPPVPAPENCPPVPVAFEGAPAFFRHMDLRFAAGSMPMTGGEPSFCMWTRHRDGDAVDPESALLAVADVLPPAALASMSAFSPASSVTWTIDLTTPPPPADSWYLLSTSSDLSAGGYSLQAMSCFAADGTLAAVGRQTVAIF
jgi:acyl-CoA thioesterase